MRACIELKTLERCRYERLHEDPRSHMPVPEILRPYSMSGACVLYIGCLETGVGVN